ncbi:MAG: peptide chain release factor N(5)-glutamine methyltransferase [Hyphomicrobiales bacterium]|nr:peptide chain release factor N(5)-glutamine methyltransferase [Hyphomicrobiales bacterium]
MTLAARTSVSAPAPAGDLWRALARRLTRNGIETPMLDAEVLLRHVTGWSRETLLRTPEVELDALQQQQLAELGEKRCRGVPVARLIGRKEFWSLEFLLSDETLVPRPESETLIEAALKGGGKDDSLRLLDLGTGCGCLLLSLLHEYRHSSGVGIDISAGAVATARCNAERLSLEDRARFQTGNWNTRTEDIANERFDILVSNPPYIRSGDIGGLQKEVREHDPRIALDGGGDGMDSLRAIIAIAPKLLRPNGRVLIEIGAGQSGEILSLMENQPFKEIRKHKDLAGIDRVIEGIVSKNLILPTRTTTISHYGSTGSI